ncbi:pyrokinin-1 receptor-like isoform X1 [Scylla paramamosain]|uniref:pyrokinin-1 receptor-like isoform X1 n=1 Tax=Scylla paramamosain TaxID=85552 RepID=UPI003083A1C3
MGEAGMGALVNSTPSSIPALTPTASLLSTFLTPTATHEHASINGSLFSVGGNGTWVEEVEGDGDQLVHGMTMTVVMTVIYFLITVTGVLGNVATCIVIVRNRIMHTATNYYLFSLAISDLLLLAFGMPDEIYMLWRGRPYIFGAYFCFVRGFTAEISTNASILTIAAFTVERYIGICHPLRSQTMSQLGRVVRSIAVIWVVAIACAVPIAIQYGIVYEHHLPSGEEDPNSSACLIKNPVYLAFEISTVLFFVAPLLLITVLYLCIAVQLKRSTRLTRAVPSITSPNSSCTNDGSRNKAVIKMLVAVVIAFFLCFAPHQTQRLVALHGDASNPAVVKLFNILHNISGISYYISTCVNPILYHIMSNRFRKALKVTLGSCLEGEKAGVGGGGGRCRSSSRFHPSHPSHSLEPVTDYSLVFDSTTTTVATTAFTSSTSSAVAVAVTPQRKSRNATSDNHHHRRRLLQTLMAVRKGRYTMARRHSLKSGTPSPARATPCSSLKIRGSDGVETPEDLFVSRSTPDERKRSQSGSVMSGGSISDCSLTHVEQEFTQKELQEVMSRMKNVEV